MVERGLDDLPKSGFSRSKSKTVPQNFFPAEERRSSQPEAAPIRPIPAERASESERAPEPRGEASNSSRSATKPPKELKAYQVDGPVEAVGLQADAEFWHVFEDTKTLGRGHFAKVKQVCHLQVRIVLPGLRAPRPPSAPTPDTLSPQSTPARPLFHTSATRARGGAADARGVCREDPGQDVGRQRHRGSGDYRRACAAVTTAPRRAHQHRRAAT